ncbi:hypothetical protein KGF57_000261 [Candida theae]|uniref:Brl1/Brr6 domain-containing protein n=1 Tax=Candida theae TaxID=1198502 RepID=A0AAD5G110_9ASCO|nr:uncharacterized protein KGF57_000261 [Candida theae]KAI5968035.1 hypothetical protein KGF57_000261 [Candida theae]
MEKEFSPITLSGIEYESTPIKRNEDDHIVVDEFLTARDENTTISIDGDELGRKQNDDVTDYKYAPAMNASTGLADPLEMADTSISAIRNRNTDTDEHFKNTISYKKSSPNQFSTASLDPYTPYVLGLYFQLVVNIILWSFVIYFIYVAITTVQSDINLKIDEFTIRILDEIAKCSKEFTRNKCHLSDRPSIMDEECDQLERCQNQDPTKIARSKVTIELIAEIINSFVNRLSYKSLFIMMFVLIIFIIHTAFTFEKFSQFKQKRRD